MVLDRVDTVVLLDIQLHDSPSRAVELDRLDPVVIVHIQVDSVPHPCRYGRE